MRQTKKARPRCPTCGKPGTKWHPLPHDDTDHSVGHLGDHPVTAVNDTEVTAVTEVTRGL